MNPDVDHVGVAADRQPGRHRAVEFVRTHLRSNRMLTSVGKIALCALLAIAIHEFLLIGIVAFYHNSVAAKYGQLVANANVLLANGLANQEDVGNVTLCVAAPRVEGGEGSCSTEAGIGDPDISPWLMLGVLDRTGKWKPVILAGKGSFLAISNPVILHSRDSLSRRVEWAAQVEYDVVTGLQLQGTTDLRLCAGTRKLLDDETCAVIANALDALGAQIDDDSDLIRIISLFFGFIQTLTLATFIYVFLEIVLLRRRIFDAPVLFFEREEPTGALRLKSGDALSEAAHAYDRAPRRSAIDEMFARLQIAMGADERRGLPLSEEAMSDTAESFREFQKGEHDEAFSTLDVANEILLKLAFAGTIWGISIALFSARNLDTVDPIEVILTKSAMFAGISTAFGTTLLGVLLSIMGSGLVQAAVRDWTERVNSNYRFMIDLGFDNIVDRVKEMPRLDPRRISGRDRPESDPLLRVLRLIGLAALVLGLAALAWNLEEVRFFFDGLGMQLGVQR